MFCYSNNKSKEKLYQESKLNNACIQHVIMKQYQKALTCIFMKPCNASITAESMIRCSPKHDVNQNEATFNLELKPDHKLKVKHRAPIQIS